MDLVDIAATPSMKKEGVKDLKKRFRNNAEKIKPVSRDTIERDRERLRNLLQK